MADRLPADERLSTAVAEVLASFCADDAGRSAAVGMGPHTSGLVGINAHEARPAASVMKVPLVMALYDRAVAGDLQLDQLVPVATLGETRYASILKAFDAGRSLSVRELAALSLIVSDNPSTVHLMSLVSSADVVDVLRRCGCGETTQMSAGFTEAELGARNRVNTLSAADAVLLFEALVAEPRYAPIVTQLENNLRNNRIPALLPDDVVVAHKTGSLEGVVNNVGVLSYGGRAFTLAVLCDGQADPIATSREIAELALELSGLLLGHPDLGVQT